MTHHFAVGQKVMKMSILECYGMVWAMLLLAFSILIFYIPLLHRKRKHLPPGPFPLPLIGCLYKIGSQPHRSLAALARKYGPIMTLSIGNVDAVVISTTEAAKLFMKTHDMQFASRPLLTVSEQLFYDGQDVGLTVYGEHWRKMRMVIVNHLLSPKSVESFREAREGQVSLMMAKLWSDSKQGTVRVDLTEAIFNAMYDVIWATIGRNTPTIKAKELLHFPRELVQNMARGFLYDFFPWMKTMEPYLRIKRRMKEAYNTFDSFAESVLQEHAATEIPDGQNKCFFDVLLDISKQDPFLTRDKIKSLMLSIFLAAIDTSGLSIEWTVSNLLKRPECLWTVQKEVDDIMGSSESKTVNESHVGKMSYLRWVVKETMRMHVSLFLPPRQAMETVRVDNYIVPKGTWVIVNGWAIARDEKVWEDPEEFRPERFAGQEEVDMTGQCDFKSLPFGGGRRGCPGYHMAFQIVFLVVASLIHNFDLQVEGEPSQLDMTTHKIFNTRMKPLRVLPKLRNNGVIS